MTNKFRLINLIRKADIIYLPNGLTIKNKYNNPDNFLLNWFKIISDYDIESYDIKNKVLQLKFRE